MSPSLLQLVEIPQRGDNRGHLSIAEFGKILPFVVRRAYWIHGTSPGVSRGFHAHRDLRQMFVCVRGEVTLTISDGDRSETFPMSAFGKAVILGPGLWRVISDFSADCILMVLADREYDESDYIRNFEQFVIAKRNG